MSRKEPGGFVGQRGEFGDVAGRARPVSLMVSQPLTTPNVGLPCTVRAAPASTSSLTRQTACSAQSGCFRNEVNFPHNQWLMGMSRRS